MVDWRREAGGHRAKKRWSGSGSVLASWTYLAVKAMFAGAFACLLACLLRLRRAGRVSLTGHSGSRSRQVDRFSDFGWTCESLMIATSWDVNGVVSPRPTVTTTNMTAHRTRPCTKHTSYDALLQYERRRNLMSIYMTKRRYFFAASGALAPMSELSSYDAPHLPSGSGSFTKAI